MNKLLNSLSIKLLLALSILLLPILIAFSIGYNSTTEQLKIMIFKDLSVMAEAYEGQVYQFLEMSKRRAQDFASDGFIRNQVRKINLGDKKGTAALNEHLVRNKKTLDKTIHDIHILSSGRIVASTDSSAIGREMQEETRAVAREGGTIVTEYNYIGFPSMMVSTPITDMETGEVIGILVNSISLTELNNVLSGKSVREMGAISWDRGKPKTLEAYIVNNDGIMISDSIFTPGAAFKQRVETLPVQACMESDIESEGFYTDYRGVEVAGVSMCLPSIKWVLIVEIDRDEVLAPVMKMKREALIAAAFVIGLTGVFFVIFFRTVLSPLKSISNAAKSLAAGDYKITIPIKSRDEVGSLSESFNIMAREIEASTLSLKKSEASLENAQRIAHLGNWDWDIANNTLHWSDEVYRIFGLRPDEFEATYTSFLNHVHPEDREFVQKSVNEAVQESRPYSVDHRVVRSGGGVRIVHEQGEVVRDENGRAISMSGTVQDVTEQKEAEDELVKLSAAIEYSVNVIFITTAMGTIEYVNPMFETVTGWTKEETIGKNASILSSGETTKAEYEELWQTIMAGKTWRGGFKNKKKDGTPFWGTAVITPIKDKKGEITHFLAVQEDVTEKRMAEERVQYLATRDEFTGLLNRPRFIELVSEWIYDNRNFGHRGVLMFLDVDGFKEINESYGHGAGDELIRYMARLMEDTLIGTDAVVARLGGDEFAVFLPDTDTDRGMAVAELIRRSVEEFQFPVLDIKLTVSIGAVSYPEHGENLKDLLTKVNASIFRAKTSGRNRCHLYRAEDMDIENSRTRIHQKIQIQKALEDGRFLPWFQPILNLKDNKAHHYEALARMQDEEGKIVLPNEFIDTAERFGMIGAIDRVITEKTMRLQAEMDRKGWHYSFAMNLSGKNLGNEELLSFLQSKIMETGADPHHLIFEITETAAVQDLDKAVKFVTALKAMGCKFSLDDFGVGFTSFVYLREMNVDFIKIDGSFIKRLHENQDDQYIVKAITGVAKGMGINTVAEFVEKEETLNLLKKFGVDYAQGYFIGKPGPNLLPD